ncbi:MAG: phosphatase domain-containing protein [Myxococcales bacterium]
MRPLKSSPLALGFSLLVTASPARATEGRPEVQVYSSIGTTHRLTVRGRALRKSGERGSTVLSRNARRLFANEEWKNVEVKVTVAGHVREVRTDGEGLFDAQFVLDDAGLPPGEHEAKAEVGGISGTGTVHVISRTDLVVVSDFDDTVAVTHVTSRRRMLTSALLMGEDTQPRVPGMPELYQALRQHRSAAFVYLSGSPIQYHHRIRAFLSHNGYPPGGIFLRQLDSGALNPAGFKTPVLKRLLRDLPDQKFLFVGDSGERDPEIYRDIAKEAGERHLGTFIRLVTPERPDAARFEGQHAFGTPSEVAQALAGRALLDADAIDLVREAEQGVTPAPGKTPARRPGGDELQPAP